MASPLLRGPAPSEQPTPHAPAASRPGPASLCTLPYELQALIVNALNENEMAQLGSTNRFWRDMVEPHLYPAHLRSREAVMQGRRHLLGRLWRTPEDASPWTTNVVDADGMTQVMHAATAGDLALLRCLMRHSDGQLQQTDVAGLRAVDWAYLAGHFGPFSTAALQVPKPQRVGPVRQVRITLHDAVAAGHWHLAATLLGPHHVRLAPGMPPVRREGYRMTQRLSCGLSGEHCVESHAPPHRPMPERLSAHRLAPELRNEAAGNTQALSRRGRW